MQMPNPIIILFSLLFLNLSYKEIHNLFTFERSELENKSVHLVLCVSYPTATEFPAILFLLLARSNSNYPPSLEGFRRSLVPNVIQIRQRVNNFPIDPHCKNCPLSYNVAESRQFLQWGSMGKFFICCQIQSKFRLIVCLKR